MCQEVTDIMQYHVTGNSDVAPKMYKIGTREEGVRLSFRLAYPGAGGEISEHRSGKRKRSTEATRESSLRTLS